MTDTTTDRDAMWFQIVWVFCLSLIIAFAVRAEDADDDATAPVGPGDRSRIVLPVSQILTPAGRQVNLPGMRPQVLALSPDGQLLATSGKTNELVLIDPVTAAELQRVILPSDKLQPGVVSPEILKPDKDAQVSYTGLIFSPDGSRIYLSNVKGDVKVFAVDADHHVTGLHSLSLPGEDAIPSGLAISRDGKRLYVVLNRSNQLAELDADTGKVLRRFDVGFAPFDVALTEHRAYVSNWGGRRPDADSLTGPVGAGDLRVRVDPVRHIASEGSISIIDLDTGQVTAELLTGLHASALAASPDGRYVVVANAGSDTISVIADAGGEIVETIPVRDHQQALFGAIPNALCFNAAGDTLYVCNGTQNAVAVFHFDPGQSKLLGLIPTGWFPGAVVCDDDRQALYVANIKGIGSWTDTPPDEKPKYKSRQYYGTLSLMQIPDAAQLEADTLAVQRNDRRAEALAAQNAPRPDAPPRALPQRSGEPSLIKHVLYIIKENRTYDQVLGDMPQGNGDPELCIFGRDISPNQHKIAEQFVLLDNTYCSGILSADGHQWADSGIVTDYLERSFAGFPRSYPYGSGAATATDALAYSPAGFIWDNAIAHGVSLRVYGEFTQTHIGWADPDRTGSPQWIDYYRDFLDNTGQTRVASEPSIESLRPYINARTVGWTLDVPDVLRAARFIEDLHRFEQEGEMPQLMIMLLPNDHTAGSKADYPTPAAMVADNDLAFGRIVEAISHSRFWADTVIIAIEDDPQAGWDHVDGFRTTAYIAGPYVKRGAVIHTRYDQPGLLRTIELILGMPPMNQIDAAARPMVECFTDTPDLTPYVAEASNIPLDQLNPPPQAITDPEQRRFALASQTLPLDEVDQCDEDLLNRILWHAQRGAAPYPAWAIHYQDDDDDDD